MTILFAHRGARAHEQENTLPAFQRALEFGATGLESDVWITADGVAVLDHDGDGIAETARNDLAPHIPDLDQFYDLVPAGIAVSLDVKDPNVTGAVLEVTRRRRVDDQLWLCYEELSDMAAITDDVGAASLVHSTYVGFMPEGFDAHVSALVHANVAVLNLHYTEWTAERIAIVRDAGLSAFAWDVQHEHMMLDVLQLGVDGVFSDHSDMMVAVANSLGITAKGADIR